jgi:hypothetical protein
MPIAWHGPYDLLKPETQDLARAIQSLMEELEAIDWYGQRMDLTHDEELRGILEHNRDEEKEHASMLIEWIRRRDPKFDEALKTYVFTSGNILALEEAATGQAASGAAAQPAPHLPVTTPGEATVQPSLAFTVGSLRPKR